MTQNQAIQVTGLREMQAALRRIDRKQSSEMRKTLKESVASPFVVDVRSLVMSRGLYSSKTKGKHLVDTIKSSVTQKAVDIKSSPPLNPGKKSRTGYAAIYEYGNGGARSFLNPTLKEWEVSGKLDHQMDDFLAWVEREFRA